MLLEAIFRHVSWGCRPNPSAPTWATGTLKNAHSFEDSGVTLAPIPWRPSNAFEQGEPWSAPGGSWIVARLWAHRGAGPRMKRRSTELWTPKTIQIRLRAKRAACQGSDDGDSAFIPTDKVPIAQHRGQARGLRRPNDDRRARRAYPIFRENFSGEVSTLTHDALRLRRLELQDEPCRSRGPHGGVVSHSVTVSHGGISRAQVHGHDRRPPLPSRTHCIRSAWRRVQSRLGRLGRGALRAGPARRGGCRAPVEPGLAGSAFNATARHGPRSGADFHAQPPIGVGPAGRRGPGRRSLSTANDADQHQARQRQPGSLG